MNILLSVIEWSHSSPILASDKALTMLKAMQYGKKTSGGVLGRPGNLGGWAGGVGLWP